MLNNENNFYKDINADNISKYQAYIYKMIETADIYNFTERSYQRTYDKNKVIEDYKKLDEILNQAELEGLNPTYLMIMFEQYINADVWKRENYKNTWVMKTLHREPTDFFPDPWAIHDNIKGKGSE